MQVRFNRLHQVENERKHSHAAVEVHAVNSNRRVVLDSEIDMFADTESEVASLGEVALS